MSYLGIEKEYRCVFILSICLIEISHKRSPDKDICIAHKCLMCIETGMYINQFLLLTTDHNKFRELTKNILK